MSETIASSGHGVALFFPNPWRRFVGRGVVPLTFLAILAAFATTLSSDHIVNWGGWSLTWRFARAALHPVLDSESLRLTAVSSVATVAFAICGSAVNVAIGTVGGLLASDTWWELVSARSRKASKGRAWPASLVRAFIAIPRGLHELVWGLFFINILGLDPLVAVLAIGIPFGAITAKVFSEIIDETPRRTALCLRASGANALVAFAYGILPSAFPLLMSYALYRLECAIRSAAILGLIGAGGLGYQIMLSLQSLRYDQVWTFLYALMLLIAFTEWASSRLMARLHLQTGSTAVDMFRRMRRLLLTHVGIVAGVLGSYWYLGLDLTKPFEIHRLKMLYDVLRASFPPRFLRGESSELVSLSLQTLAMSVVAIVMAGAAAIVASWFATSSLFVKATHDGTSRRSARGVALAAMSILVRCTLIGIRALSDGIWVLIALFIFFPGAFAGAFALAVYNFGVLGRLLTQVNEDADTKPFWALRAQGASFSQAILYGLLPLTFPKYLAYILYRWEVCVRATVVVGIVGAGGLGFRLEQQMASFYYRGVAATLTIYVLLTIFVDSISSSGRRALRTAS